MINPRSIAKGEQRGSRLNQNLLMRTVASYIGMETAVTNSRNRIPGITANRKLNPLRDQKDPILRVVDLCDTIYSVLLDTVSVTSASRVSNQRRRA